MPASAFVSARPVSVYGIRYTTSGLGFAVDTAVSAGDEERA
jgi:hypothetical protein